MSAVFEEFSDVLAGWERAPADVSITSAAPKPVPPVHTRVPLKRFVSGAELLVSEKPIQITLHFEDGYFIAENETLHIVATGESTTEAVDDFSEQLIHFYNYYSALDDGDVTGSAVSIKAIYADYFSDQSVNAA